MYSFKDGVLWSVLSHKMKPFFQETVLYLDACLYLMEMKFFANIDFHLSYPYEHLLTISKVVLCYIWVWNVPQMQCVEIWSSDWHCWKGVDAFND